MNLEQEKDLIERAKYSQEAFGELYEMYYNCIFNYALRRCANIEIAKDVTSVVFFKALKYIKNYRWEGIPFSHWLYRIANHELVDQYNNRKFETSLDLTTIAGSLNLQDKLVLGEDTLRKYETYMDIQKYISELSPKYQEVITLRYFEDKELKEIAEILGKPEGTVKSLLHRGIEKLRRTLSRDEEEQRG
jgi:RNA polymerase sigma-70 factor (ECF subfamily)